MKQVAAVGKRAFRLSVVLVMVNGGIRLRNPPTGKREQPVQNLEEKVIKMSKARNSVAKEG